MADGAYALAVRLLNLFLAAALGILTARALGPYGRGIYALPMVNAALVTAAFAGLTSATSYMLLRYENHRKVLLASLGSALVFTLVGAVCTIALAALLRHPWTAIPAMISLPGTALLLVAYGYAIGTHRVRINPTLAAMNTVSLIAVMLLAFTLLGRAPSSAIAAWLIGTNVVGLACAIWMIVDVIRTSVGNGSAPAFASTLGFSARVGAVSLVSLLNYRADVYLVALFTGPVQLGVYTIAISAAEAMLTMTQVTSLVTQARIGSLPTDQAAAFTARCVRHNVLVAAAGCGAAFLVAPFLVRLVYGAPFASAGVPLRILLAGVFALSLGAPISNYFTIRLGRPEVALVLASTAAAICIVVSLLLIPRYGLTGAAIGSTSAYCAGQIAAFLYFARTTNLSLADLLIPRASDASVYLRILKGGRTDQRARDTSELRAG